MNDELTRKAEETAKRLLKTIPYHADKQNRKVNQLEEDIYYLAQAYLSLKREWINVDKELPTRDRNILMCDRWGQIETGYCALDTDIFHSDSGDIHHVDVRYWMYPPPEPEK